jgi:hypothetical protein
MNRFDITAASQAVYKATARSGVGEQLQALTDELGAELFVRNGNHLVGLTDCRSGTSMARACARSRWSAGG